jgi:hypothetical protein
MTNLLDERIDHRQSMDRKYGLRVVLTLFHGAPIPRYRQYHRPIESLEHLGCNRFVAADSVGCATLKKTGLAAPLACQEQNNEHYR